MYHSEPSEVFVNFGNMIQCVLLFCLRHWFYLYLPIQDLQQGAASMGQAAEHGAEQETDESANQAAELVANQAVELATEQEGAAAQLDEYLPAIDEENDHPLMADMVWSYQMVKLNRRFV
jgi:hypothetical protein